MAGEPTDSVNRVTPFDGNRIFLASTADDAYAMPLAVMLQSVSTNLPTNWTVEAYILDAGLAASNRRRVVDLCYRMGNMRVHWCYPNVKLLPRPSGSGQYGLSAYLRLLLEGVLPKHVGQILYLDCDLIVQADLIPLWQTDMTRSLLAAVRDFSVETVSEGIPNGCRELGLAPDEPYFNSGVLLINMNRWRHDDVQARALAYVHAHQSSLAYADQDVLNAIACGAWCPLDPEWNVQVGGLLHRSARDGEQSPFARGLLERRADLLAMGRVLHFVSPHKPWHAGLYRPVRRQFLRQMHASGWFSPVGLALYHAWWVAATGWRAVNQLMRR